MKSTVATPASTSRRRKAASWVTLGALLLNLLAAVMLPPSMAGAAVPGAAGASAAFDTIVVCMPNGIRIIKVDADGAPLPEQSVDTAFCVFCLPLTAGNGCTPAVQATVTAPPVVTAGAAVAAGVRQTPYSISLESRPTRAPPTFA